MKNFIIWAMFISVVCLCDVEGCRQLNNCMSCAEAEASRNMSCEWVTCGSLENSTCVPSMEQRLESCTVTNHSSMCTVHESRSSEPEELQPEDSPKTNIVSPPVFHTGSFIGGGVLVILLQAVGYFVLKHLRGPEGQYQTMEETPQ